MDNNAAPQTSQNSIPTDSGFEAPKFSGSAAVQSSQDPAGEFHASVAAIAEHAPHEFAMAAAALGDLVDASRAWEEFSTRGKVVVFGSARIAEGSPVYNAVAELARLLAAEGFAVVTGGGPGVMSAGLQGAGRGSALGISVTLPFESPARIDDIPVIELRRFFTRKLALVRSTRAVIVAPGGFGTLDELFEVLTLLQTGKKSPTPVVLFDADSSGFWDGLLSFIDTLVATKMVAASDVALFTVARSAQDAFEQVMRFQGRYRDFTTHGGVGRILFSGPLPITSEMLDIEFPVFAPFAMSEHDSADGILEFTFDRRNFGLLRQLIDRVNS